MNQQLALTIQNEPSQGLWTRLESLLVEVVLASTANQQIRASLLNVSQPTLRKLIGQLESSAAS
ncbi:hypothetical protein RS130_03330 [Paraglaciecola aquimarina]|uniref:HTH lysR-type domain-containing protein n=1 Tax=Paraglaciecola aquimarina TaxID=1235557 RepID=A0ABU3SSU9_9ALTE|nr:hypothetical protein [Paraglaciecola aquimarina]MDU0353090.1 hypothetical protein [Paraglaciecola aquimarina]